MNIKCYERIEKEFENKIACAYLTDFDGNKKEIKPFEYQPIKLIYDEEGIEHLEKDGEITYKIRFTVKTEGDYTLEVALENGETIKEQIKAQNYAGNGYVEVSKNDRRYFAYSDGTSFYSVGINLAFPRACIVSDNHEFGVSNQVSYMGLRQYERWFKKCAEAGVNVARVWLGHDYFSPDTKVAEAFNLMQFTKIDMLLELAKKYGIKLKLTLEQFRFFVYNSEDNSNVFRYFNKNLYLNGERCSRAYEWLTNNKWKKTWLNKIEELAKRYSGDTGIFAIELWNEMNAVGCDEKCLNNEVLEWNKEMLPEVKTLFPDNMVINSLGSLDCEEGLDIYNRFPWELSSFKQMHRYLDQGASYKDCSENPIEVIKYGINMIKDNTMPFFVAETGAVNNCHSGEFKYYSCDDRGIIFVDCVYTPVFLGCAGCGNIWHWDERYVESKNLYKYFKPLADIVKDIDFQNENFESIDLSDDDTYMFILKGKTASLCFVRNKKDCWKNVLRDMNEPELVKEKIINIKADSITEYPIWDNDTTQIEQCEDNIKLNNILYGTIFKINEVK